MTTPSPTTAPVGSPVVEEPLAGLVERARTLAVSGGRRILGITGTPGAGKSTVCAALIEALGAAATIVEMDGFHLSNAELVRLGLRDRKGAPDTFDVGGYLALLRRLRAQSEDVVYTPVFDRSLEESIGSARPIRRETPLVVTEGNYLLAEENGWAEVAPLLDEVWYLDVTPEERRRRLVQRRLSHGDSPDSAQAWVCDVDEGNAVRVEATRAKADLVVRIVPGEGAPSQNGPRKADEGEAS